MPADNAKILHLTVYAEQAGLRLDKFLALAAPELSRAQAQRLLAEGHVLRNGEPITHASSKVAAGNAVQVTLPAARPTALTALDLPLDVVFEDNHLLVINKPAGLTVHPAAGHADDTLVNALLAHCGTTLSGIGGEMRPGIVHRLDKDTSGLMVVAKNDAAHRALAAQLADRSLSRRYMALVWGMPAPRSGTVTGNIGRSTRNRKKMAVVTRGGKPAVTHYTTKQSYCAGAASLLECKLESGRTHQIRVHMAHIGHPLVGDPLYGGSRRGTLKTLPDAAAEALAAFPRQALHAAEIGFVHPASGEKAGYSIPLPEDMVTLMNKINCI